MKTTTIARTTIAIAMLGVLVTSPAFAQKGSFEIALGGGLAILDDKLGGDTGLALDLRAGYFFTDRFQLEIQRSNASSILEGSFTALTLNALFHFEIESDFVPYVVVGAGTTDAEISRGLFTSSIDDDGTALRAGVGGRFSFGSRERFTFRLELAAMSENSFGYDATHVGASGLLGWRFGG